MATQDITLNRFGILENDSKDRSICVSTNRPSPLIPRIPDKYVIVLLPVIAYWTYSLLFHICDVHNFLSRYRLHTPAEISKRNRVAIRSVIQAVLQQHLMQVAMAAALAYHEPDELLSCEEVDIAALASRLRSTVMIILGLTRLDLLTPDPRLTKGAVSMDSSTALAFQTCESPSWELSLASFLYRYLIPAFQYAVACFAMDTIQFFVHIIMHSYPYLYRTFHAHHHRLYIPYAFGALYNHPLEGFLEDTVGSGLAYKFARLSVRQGIWFFTVSAMKTVDDHSGYRIPWDPFQWIGENDALYHDIHHQSWGMKSNFSQPWTTFWDRVFGTRWSGSTRETRARYEKGKLLAQASPRSKSE